MWFEQVADVTEGAPERVERSGLGLAKVRFDLGKGLFNGINTRSWKNDAADAEAICEAVTRPTMRFVPIKSPDAQSVLMLHRARKLLVRCWAILRTGKPWRAPEPATPTAA